MGCDIHCFAEIKKDGKWEKVGEVFDDIYYNPDKPKNKYNKPKTEEPYAGRNYDLFAILANVRNGYGFAGCDTGEGFVPICQPKGLPNDVCHEIKSESDSWGCDGHSHSWHTLKDLLDYDWEQVTVKRGWVSEGEYKEFKESGKDAPDTYCGGVSGIGVAHVTNEEMDEIISGNMPKEEGKTYYTQLEWAESYRERCIWFCENTIPALIKLGDKEFVRIVFWFDN